MLKRLLAVPIGMLCLSLFLVGGPGLAEEAGDDDPAPPEGAEVMARGPVHEAFAEPSAPRAEAPPVVPKAPPDPVEEAPPEEKPEGDNVVWIPGYWAWDEDGKDFLWVS